MTISELRMLKQIEDENRRLKRLVVDLILDKQILSGSAFKKALRPATKRDLAEEIGL